MQLINFICISRYMYIFYAESTSHLYLMSARNAVNDIYIYDCNSFNCFLNWSKQNMTVQSDINANGIEIGYYIWISDYVVDISCKVKFNRRNSNGLLPFGLYALLKYYVCDFDYW